MPAELTDVHALAQGVERLTGWLRRQTPAKTSTSTLTALDRLRTQGPLRVSELARREAMTQPGVTLLVNRLAESGWARRMPDPTDGRATLVDITEAGLAVLAERHDQRSRVLREHFSRLSDDDQRLLIAALPAMERLARSGSDDVVDIDDSHTRKNSS